MASRTCAHCGTPFQLRPQGQHAKFCATACRVANHKQRDRSNLFSTPSTLYDNWTLEKIFQAQRESIKTYVVLLGHRKTLQEIADHFSVSQDYVSQIATEIIDQQNWQQAIAV